MVIRCKVCRFFNASNDGSSGTCRRISPRACEPLEKNDTAYEPKWPVVSANDWCGEGEPREGPDPRR